MSRGITKDIRELLSSGQIDSTFTAETVSENLVGASLSSINSALSRMARAGEITRFGGRDNRSYQTPQANTAAALEDLLTAINAAKPALRKAIKLMKTLEEVNNGA